ncbi:helix-turn-helix domain-containing protein [Geotalea sp. SG265]|uniref:helix-turn-helix domain-containing protein n=1 Tax=Geotalea sp. SG265 TaxID=2922867 RepID=UPI001FAEF52E|nr:helix-turn-helix domain-containing protein [Geotalea sp. SG265]
MDESYEILGLAPGAERSEVKRAYQRRKELYSRGSLAIYSLASESDRESRLEQVESAYQRILSFMHLHGDEGEHTNSDHSPSAPMPDPEMAPGEYLRWARNQAGLSIRQLADRTKISTMRLDDIESERIDHLPPPVYLRGFVYEFARSLGLVNAFQLSEFYLRRVASGLDD